MRNWHHEVLAYSLVKGMIATQPCLFDKCSTVPRISILQTNSAVTCKDSRVHFDSRSRKHSCRCKTSYRFLRVWMKSAVCLSRDEIRPWRRMMWAEARSNSWRMGDQCPTLNSSLLTPVDATFETSRQTIRSRSWSFRHDSFSQAIIKFS